MVQYIDMIVRDEASDELTSALKRSRVVALLGPRQCGKTTMARQLVSPASQNYFDLEDPLSLARLSAPELALAKLRGLVVIDEVQRRPELFPLLRVLADRKPLRSKFLILGSASPVLLRQSSETLAGRLEVVNLGGLTLTDVGTGKIDRHWLRGGFPQSFLARSEEDSRVWRREFVKTFLERDIMEVGTSVVPAALGRFWHMLAHYHAQIWNGAELARSMGGVSETTVRKYVDLLEGMFMVRQLRPWFDNLGKRLVKSPKMYMRDSGLLHTLLGVPDALELEKHPKVGASWEGYVIEQVITWMKPQESYFWATHNGAELDLLMLKNGKRFGVECKYSDAPTLTPSMKLAMQDLKLQKLYVVYPGKRRYPLADKIEAVPLPELISGSLAKK